MGGRGTSAARERIERSPREEALKRLGLEDPPEVNSLFTHAIKVVGSKKKFLEYARESEHEGVVAFFEKWDSLSKTDQHALSIVDVCAAVDLKLPTLLGEVTAQAFAHNTDLSKLIAAVAQPRVVKATVDSATKYLGPDGVKDRQMLHLHSNFVPVSKSSQTIFRFQQQINNAREAGADEPIGLPPFEQDVITINAAQRNKLLPALVEEREEA